jgi:Ca2+-binding EF-hand superfamily protein
MKNRYSRPFIIAALFVTILAIDEASAVQKSAVPRKTNAIALGAEGVRQVLAVMDMDEGGTISKRRFMKFMETEFDRLDKDENGELDAKELAQSPSYTAPFARAGK